MMARALVGLLASCTSAAALPEYRHAKAYVGEDFFSKWNFWTASDPTKGFVDYVDEETARTHGLARAASNHVYMGADWSEVAGDAGRRSVRIQSKEMYNQGLFIANIDHIPTGCGTWPAFWMFGEDSQHIWPRWGEYDIIEGVHMENRASTTLHTTPDCDQASVDARVDFAQKWNPGATGHAADDCDISAPGQWHNQGCSQRGPENSMGPGFNAHGGGTYAAEWDPEAGHVRTWFWPSGTEPSDVTEHRPEPSTWGKPYSFFSLAPRVCTPDHFKNMRLTFDLTFCGDLGNPTFAAGCPAAAGAGMTCNAFVKNHPQNLTEAYWSIRALDVYQRAEGTTVAVPVTPTPPRPASTSAPTPAPEAAPSPRPRPVVPFLSPAPTPQPLLPTSSPTTRPMHSEQPQPTEPPAPSSTPVVHWQTSSARETSHWPREVAAGALAMVAVLAIACFLKLKSMSHREEPLVGSPRGSSDAGRSLRFADRLSMGCNNTCDVASDMSGSPRSSRAPGSPLAEAPLPAQGISSYTWDQMLDSDAMQHQSHQRYPTGLARELSTDIGQRGHGVPPRDRSPSARRGQASSAEYHNADIANAATVAQLPAPPPPHGNFTPQPSESLRPSYDGRQPPLPGTGTVQRTLLHSGSGPTSPSYDGRQVPLPGTETGQRTMLHSGSGPTSLSGYNGQQPHYSSSAYGSEQRLPPTSSAPYHQPAMPSSPAYQAHGGAHSAPGSASIPGISGPGSNPGSASGLAPVPGSAAPAPRRPSMREMSAHPYAGYAGGAETNPYAAAGAPAQVRSSSAPYAPRGQLSSHAGGQATAYSPPMQSYRVPNNLGPMGDR